MATGEDGHRKRRRRTPTTPAQRDQRRVRVMRMYNSGLTMTAIAEKIGVGVGTVDRDIKHVLSEHLRVPTQEYVARHLAEQDDLRRAVFAQALTGDLDAWDRVLRLQERQAKLLGLDAPQRVVAHVSTEDFAATAATLMREMGLTPPDAIESAAPEVIDTDGWAMDEGVDPIVLEGEREAAQHVDDWVE